MADADAKRERGRLARRVYLQNCLYQNCNNEFNAVGDFLHRVYEDLSKASFYLTNIKHNIGGPDK